VLTEVWKEALTISVKNLLDFCKYRRYYYDVETGWYYLNSRYYDPALGRFLNADTYASTGQSVLGSNMFAYCLNDPINRVDPSGSLSIFGDDVDAVEKIKELMKKVQEAVESSKEIAADQTGVAGLGINLSPLIEKIGIDFSEFQQQMQKAMQKTQAAVKSFMSLFKNIGRNGVDYYWWGYRVYIDGPTCDIFSNVYAMEAAGLRIAGFFYKPFLIPSGMMGILAAEMKLTNQGKGVYYDVYWLPVLPGGHLVGQIVTMRPQE